MFWSSYGVVLMSFLGYFEIVLIGIFFLNLLTQEFPHGCQKQVGGGWSRPLLENVQKEAAHFFKKASPTVFVIK